ncbi:MAG: UPF0182 family protein [Nocardioides sp.]
MSDLFDDDPRRQPAPPPPSPPRRSRALLITAAVLIVGFFALTTAASFFTDRMWYSAVGFSEVFSVLFWTRAGLFLVFGALMALVVGVNIYVAYRLRPVFRPQSPEQTSLDRYRDAVDPIRTWLLVGVALLLALFAGTSAAGQWRQYLLWRNGGEFDSRDQYFDKDIGFYLFDLPWLHYLVDSAMAFAFVAALLAALVHYLYGGVRLQATRDRLSPGAQAQLSLLLGVFVLAKGADYWLDRYDLVHESGRLITGITYTDDHAVLPAKNILMAIALICAVLFFLNVWRRTWLLPSVGLALLVLSAILLGMIWPGVVQQFQVNPTEADKEAPYIESNIEATRTAYDLGDAEVQDFTSEVSIDDAQLTALSAATSSVPLVDPQLVKQTFEQQQQVRAYYSVADVLDVDKYTIDGEERALVLGVRELDQAGINEDARNWSNLHTVYTHGNGVIAAYANQRPFDNDVADSNDIQWAEGQQAGEDALTNLTEDGYESRVYYGERSPDYSVVGKREGASDVELDLGNRSSGDEGQTTTFDGEGGVEVGSFLDQLLYAVKFGEPNFILSERVNENSKVLYYRKPLERVEKLAPWLTLDKDPYPAVVDGRIQWIIDGYTTTDRFPLAQRESFEEMTTDSLDDGSQFGTLPTDEINYMRNAVKATVDAYDGSVNLYAWDESDPILEAWRGAFPGTVQDREDIPDGLMQHLRYPEDLFKVQRYQFARYHITNADDFYTDNNRWEVPQDPEEPSQYQPPYRLFVNRADSEGQNFDLTSVYVPYDKNNLAAFVSVGADATNPDTYGKMRVLELPDEQTPGPGTIRSEMTTSDNVRRELLAFQSGGSKPVYGNLLTLPAGTGLMYVQPVYATRELSEASFPELQFVIVSYGDRVGIGQTMPEAIADALGVDPESVPEDTGNEGDGDGGGGQPEPPTGTVAAQIRDLLNRAQTAFNEADAAFREGDTVTWARKTQEAKDLVDRAVTLAEQQPRQPRSGN